MSAPVLEVSGLDGFYGTSQVLFGMSLSVDKGETLALLGRNGAGKSSTIKAIAGILIPKTGSVQLLGREMRGQPPHVMAKAGLGYVPEDRQIFPELSVQDNLEIAVKKGLDGRNEWTVERIYDMLPILAPLKTRMGGQLSGGEQQMLTVGRALMGNPSVLLLDEPSEGLAPIMVQKIGDLIESLRKLGTTIVLAEQNLHFCLGLADRAVVIDRGTSVYSGSLAELGENEEVKQRYLSV
jgi:branched-chain amino acid transport system ATP-binding protein